MKGARPDVPLEHLTRGVNYRGDISPGGGQHRPRSHEQDQEPGKHPSRGPGERTHDVKESIISAIRGATRVKWGT